MSNLMRFSVIYIFVSFYLTAVSCLKVIERFTGEDALLPCVYKGRNPPPETLSIFWRDKDNCPVLNIKNNTADNSSQHQKFRGRVESFPDLYKDGNFSIILKKVQQLDNGVYECHVPVVDVEQRVQLSVLGERAAAATSPAPGSSAHITATQIFSLLITNITADDCRLYFCGRRINGSIKFMDTFSLVSDVPVGPPNNSSMENDDNQHLHLLIRQYKFTLYGSFVLNFLLVTGLLCSLIWLKKKKNCSRQVTHPSPNNTGTLDSQQYAEIQFPLIRAPPPAASSECIYSKVKLPHSTHPGR